MEKIPPKTSSKISADKVPFGFEQISADEKPKKVKAVFSSVADKYDVMNDVMSVGMHRLWKKRLVEELQPGRHLLDIAGGTADIARLYIKKGGRHVTLCDLTLAMLQKGQARIFDHHNQAEKFTFIAGDGENLPFKDKSFDYITLAFGLRNMTYPEKALTCAYRCLKPGGRFLILEFSPLDDAGTEAGFAKIYDFWCFKILPQLGKYIAQDADSYQYLAESIRRFPKADKLQKMMMDAGFTQCSWQYLSAGIVAIHSGFRTRH